MATKPITDPFVLHACELLSGLGLCQAKRMFGGFGLSVDGMNLGLIAWDTLYLKTNADTEPQWLAAGGESFVYEAKGKPMKLNYHTPPAEALESPVSYFYDGLEEAIERKEAANQGGEMFSRKETLDLVQAYYQLGERPRRRLLDLAKSLHAEGDAT